MPLEEWAESKETLHRYLQIVGKIRLAGAPRRNHWWNIPFHLTGRGITTRPMGVDPIFAIDFDFVDHRLLVDTVNGDSGGFPLEGHTVASFYDRTLALLAGFGIAVVVRHPYPFDLSDRVPFAEDDRPRAYDRSWVNRYWRVLSGVNLVLEEFAGDFSGKTSPVHHFWHTMDIAVTRFSDRVVAHDDSVDPVTREAYSREVISSGFWFGDDSFPESAFYSYTSPEPDGLADVMLEPATAEWRDQGGSHLGMLRYDDARRSGDVRPAALEFYESAYQAGAALAGWDVAATASPGGSTA